MSKKLLTLKEVQNRIPYRSSSIYAKMSAGNFPRPINLGSRRVAWLESDIDEWLVAMIVKSKNGVEVIPEPVD